MSKIPFPKNKIERRVCPGCGFIESQVEVELLRYNFDCPRCKKHGVKDFVIESFTPPPKPRGRKARRKAA